MMAKGKSYGDNVVPRYTKFESMVSPDVTRRTEMLVTKEILTLVADSLDNILQFAYERVCTGVLSVSYIVGDISNLMCRTGK